jgi:hypothetical protein
MIFSEGPRALFGFGNPNHAGAFFAMLAICMWGLQPHLRSRFASRLAGLLSLACVVAVLLTASRGAFLALMVGFIALWISSRSRDDARTFKHLVVLGVSILALALLFGRMGSRLMDVNASEGSTNSRLTIMSAVPSMMRAAPQGWGFGNAANAYHNWFQAIDDHRLYKHLISSHATWLVEGGWGFRFFYIACWSAALAFSYRFPIAFGVLACFASVLFFNHVGWDWRVWVIPAIVLVASVVVEPSQKHKFRIKVLSKLLLLSCGVSGSLLLLALLSKTQIRLRGETVYCGYGEPRVMFYRPSLPVLGIHPGKEVRANSPASFSNDPNSLHAEKPAHMVLSGMTELPEAGSMSFPYSLVWLNPPPTISENGKAWIKNAKTAKIIWGGLRSDGSARNLMNTIGHDVIWETEPSRATYLGGAYSRRVLVPD